MNATIENLDIRCEKKSSVSINKGYDEETHPYSIIANEPKLDIAITTQQARELFHEMLSYFAEDAEEYLREREEEVRDERVSSNAV